MNAENAESLNNAGVTAVQAAYIPGHGGCYVSYQCGSNWYSFDYDGYVDCGYHESWNYTPSLDAYAPHESSSGSSGNGVVNHGGGCCRGVTTGATGGKYMNNHYYAHITNVVTSPNKGSNNKLRKAAKVMYGVTNMEYGLIDGLAGTTTQALRGVKGPKLLSPINFGISLALTAPIMISENIDYNNGKMSRDEYIRITSLTAAEFIVPLAATGLVAAGVIAAPALVCVIVVTGIVTAVDAAGGFNGLIYDDIDKRP